MEKTGKLIGLPVLCAENGKKLGAVQDIVFCPGKREIKGFVLDSRGLEIGKRMIFLKDVLNVGRDAVIVESPACRISLNQARAEGKLKDEGNIIGLKIYTKAGEDLGVVKDVLFDQKTGLVEGVEVSDGLLQDVLQGRKVIPLFGKVEFGDETLLVDREAVEETETTGGGIKKLLGEQGKG